MLFVTDCQLAADALYQGFLVNMIAEAEAQVGSNSEDSSQKVCTLESLSGCPTVQVYLNILGELYSQRYLNAREEIVKDSTQLHLLLMEWKINCPEIFCSYLCINPSCFEDLVNIVQDDPIFSNNSNNPQMPVQVQVAITLYCFGHYGNAASTMKVGLWAGVGVGTVPLVTKWVIKALCSECFRSLALQWSSDQAKATVKAWVEEASCPAWRDGWLMVDGTLVPLFMQPTFSGNTWFDHKSNYSMNVQIISTPDLQIIDYGVGLPGSQHDATAWVETCIPNEHERLLRCDEWVWGDSAYPLKNWCQASYKKSVLPLCSLFTHL
ncbi:hypothetical protein L208DRAFT_1299822 [Tricholoma matsutake]|nr:hypothetical protein L208DRAFT_1299822 [Tricholoma matsutake 945]